MFQCLKVITVHIRPSKDTAQLWAGKGARTRFQRLHISIRPETARKLKHYKQGRKAHEGPIEYQ